MLVQKHSPTTIPLEPLNGNALGLTLGVSEAQPPTVLRSGGQILFYSVCLLCVLKVKPNFAAFATEELYGLILERVR